jgi:D-sedoheptulose 7-phosphate isomerase
MNWDDIAGDYLAVAQQIFGDLRPAIEQAAADIAACLKSGGKLLICGNGGSAADAQHVAGELVNRFLRDRRPYAAIALSTDTSVLTSIGNDFGFERAFEKQVLALGRSGDILLAISTSGNAANVCLAAEAAKGIGVKVLALTGGQGGRLAGLADRVLCLSCTAGTPRIQEGHQLIYHILCEDVELRMEGLR